MKPSLHYDVASDGTIERRAVRFGTLTLGGVGWIQSSSSPACRSAMRSEQNLRYLGHANDDPLAPRIAEELPF